MEYKWWASDQIWTLPTFTPLPRIGRTDATESNIIFPQSLETLLEPFAFNNTHFDPSEMIWGWLLSKWPSYQMLNSWINGNISWSSVLFATSRNIFLYMIIWVAPNTLNVSPCNSEQTFSDMVAWSDCHDQPSSFSRVATLRGAGAGVIQTLVKCTMRLIQI